MLTKDWKENKRPLLDAETRVREEILEQGGGDPDEALDYAAVSLRAARVEQDRLQTVIGRLRLTNQRLQFPGIFPPNLPVGAEAVAQLIYDVAATAVELMRREGMESDYDVTFNSLVEIASYGERREAA